MPRTYNETARSKQEVTSFYVVSEGEIEEISEIFINELSLKGSKVAFAWLPGTFNQPTISGFTYISDGIASAGELTKNGGAKVLGPFTTDIEFVDVIVATTGMHYDFPSGTIAPTPIAIFVHTKKDSDAFVSRNRIVENTSLTFISSLYGWQPHPDLATHVAVPLINRKEKVLTPYSFSVRINKPAGTTTNWQIKLTRKTTDSGTYGQETRVSVSNINYETFRNTDNANYSGTAVAAIKVEDLSEVNNNVPLVGFKGKGIKVKVPSTSYYDAYTRTYTGNPWDGTFSSTKTWTSNLSWILYNLLSDTLDKTIPINPERTITVPVAIGLGVPESKMAKYTFDKFAKYCDQSIHGEKRYSLNGQVIEQAEFEQVLNNILSVGNAQLSEINGLLSVTYEHELSQGEIDNSPILTNENVINGIFSYSNSHISENFTQINVTIQDKQNFNRLKTIMTDSRELMQWLRSVNLLGLDKPYKIPSDATDDYFVDIYGYSMSDILLKFTNSEAAGARKARNILWESILNNEFISFSTTIQGAQFYKGKHIRIADAMNNNVTSTGRIISSSYNGGLNETTLILDRNITLPSGISYIHFYKQAEIYNEVDLDNTTTPYQELKMSKLILLESSITTNSVKVSGNFLPIDESIFIIDNSIVQIYTVVSNMLTDVGYETTCVKYDINKFSFVDKDYTIPTVTRFKQPILKNTPVDAIETDYLTNGTPNKGVHIENNDGTRVNGRLLLKWEHDDTEVVGAGQTVYYEVKYMLTIAPGQWKTERVSTKMVEIHIQAPMPNDIQLLNAEDISGISLPDDTFVVEVIITTKSNFASPSTETYLYIPYTIYRGAIAMVNSGATDDL